MKPLLIWLAGVLISGPSLSAAASTPAPTLACTYGTPVSFNAGILQYNDFTVWLSSKSELVTTEGRTPWTVWKFEVRDRANRTIGGDITFNREARANGRRFDVQGKIYVAEMFSSTSDSTSSPGSTGPASRLGPDQIIIWDEASAAKHNPLLSSIWKNEHIDPESRWSASNAYADGIFIPGFSPPTGKFEDGASRLAGNSLKAEKISLVRYATRPPTGPVVTCDYGIRTFYQAGVLRFPDFTLQLFEREESNSFDLEKQFTSYRFFVYDAAGVQLPGSVAFSTYDLANGRAFRVAEKTYVAEMFFSTANQNTGSPVGRHLPLREGELIVWNESTARRGNTKLLAVWNSAEPGRSSVLAAGTPVALGIFHSTLATNAAEWLRPSDLDNPLTVSRSVQIVYPDDLSGSGFIAHLSGAILVNVDGTVDQAHIIDSNTNRFNQPAYSALKQWRFSIPQKNGRAVKAVVPFTWTIFEPVSDSIRLSLK